MSLNELTSQDIKPWLNIECNNLSLSQGLKYKQASATQGYLLQLDAFNVPQWVPAAGGGTADLPSTLIPISPASQIQVAVGVIDLLPATIVIPDITSDATTITFNNAGRYWIMCKLALLVKNTYAGIEFFRVASGEAIRESEFITTCSSINPPSLTYFTFSSMFQLQVDVGESIRLAGAVLGQPAVPMFIGASSNIVIVRIL